MRKWEYASLFVDHHNKFFTISGASAMRDELAAQANKRIQSFDGLVLSFNSKSEKSESFDFVIKSQRLIRNSDDLTLAAVALRQLLLNSLGAASWEAYAYCQMPNYCGLYELKKRIPVS